MEVQTRSPRDVAVAAVVNAMRRITRELRLAAEGTRTAAGMSAAQLFVLRHLSDGEARSLTELARLTLTDRTSVAAVVERLTAQGLTERARSERDRRRSEVKITAEGWRRLASAPAAPTSLLIAGLEGLPDGTLMELAVSMDALVEAMGLQAERAEMLFEDLEGETPA